MDLKVLSNIELAKYMHDLEHRAGLLSLWMDESHRRICTLIADGPDSALQKQMDSDSARGITSLYTLTGTIKRELTLKQEAEVERYTILADLKKIEIELDRRVG